MRKPVLGGDTITNAELLDLEYQALETQRLLRRHEPLPDDAEHRIQQSILRALYPIELDPDQHERIQQHFSSWAAETGLTPYDLIALLLAMRSHRLDQLSIEPEFGLAMQALLLARIKRIAELQMQEVERQRRLAEAQHNNGEVRQWRTSPGYLPTRLQAKPPYVGLGVPMRNLPSHVRAQFQQKRDRQIVHDLLRELMSNENVREEEADALSMHLGLWALRNADTNDAVNTAKRHLRVIRETASLREQHQVQALRTNSDPEYPESPFSHPLPKKKEEPS
ncbi:hypothetical protein [Deinococcus peraridilitoris]|uniref:Uncharacterized protein n=1 Tax=Deinococcus peraridilitoris (strain DSM 19664 / LMG 22246 / CIP 109416 / KR-200) TaxID=937777 RepID=L0A2G3_DEIPD|nr:hypothetical protein [Deinococcus peraridilitoris]AFZ67190.1 hypothetical protein Deipe_1657 [Deinococcus peraridilitoris DSM 19664]